jgi:tryptophan halogenase
MRPKGLNSIAVVGAGSAGWMTALFIKQLLPTCNVTVIGSKELGILGAGEGTVPDFKKFLDVVKIHPYDFYKFCKSTTKLGIKFVNWKGDGDAYYNSFSNRNFAFNKPKISEAITTPMEGLYPLMSCYIAGHKISDYDIVDQQMEKLTMPFAESEIFSILEDGDLRSAWHFDAVEITNFFHSVGASRGINYVDDYINSFSQDDQGYINKINMNNSSLDCDFVFDCSGFRRLIIGKLYNQKWVDVSDRLTVNRALPFFLSPSNPLKNYTTATAMKNGWVWEIPLQHRTGCGYVFNSKFCDDETAIKELKEKYGEQIEITRSFSFTPGYFKNTWIKNCIALGLSSVFLEPIEATSIWTTTSSLLILANFISNLPKANQALIDNYNRKITNINDSNIAFIQFHYLSGRNDTEFWRDISRKPIADQDKSIYEALKVKIPLLIDLYPYSDAGIGYYSWSKVGVGIGFLDKQMVREQIEIMQDHHHDFEQNKAEFKTIMEERLSGLVSHQRFLEIIVGKEKLEENRRLIFQ